MAVPNNDAELVPWSTNVNARLASSAIDYGLTPAQGLTYSGLHVSYIAAYDAISNPGTRSSALVSVKNAARAALINYARELYGFVQANAAVSDARKIELGVTVRAQPAPIPAPTEPPRLDIVSMVGRTMTLRLHDGSPLRRGRPDGVDGASVFKHVGPTPPDAIEEWVFDSNTSQSNVEITFDASAVPGTKVWVTAFWFNPRKQSSPACEPVSATIQFGGVSMAA